MTTVTASTKRTQYAKAPELRGANLALGSCTDREVCLDGPAGSGKTVAALFKIHLMLSTYPGARALVARKTNTALSGSAMVTYRDNILRGRSDIRWFGGNKVQPAAYRYPNGSEMIVNGLDKPEKVLSAEFDYGYINEATECNLDDVEFVRIRLRPRTGGPDVPYRQLMMDCNPSYPTHWLNERMNTGITKRLMSRHKDNPRYFDVRTQDWTAEGREYIFGILEGLTGVRRKRYLDGVWAAAEGMVYENYDPFVHVLSLAQLVEWQILKPDGTINPTGVRRVLATVDWGFANPGVITVHALDADSRAYLVHEVYKTRETVDKYWVPKAVELKKRYGIEQFICDPAQPAYIEQFNRAGCNAVGAVNDIIPGINAMQSRLTVQADGRARFYLYANALEARDEARAEQKQPCCTADEILEYVWPKAADGKPLKEVPVDDNNHGLDTCRYLCMALEGPSADTMIAALKERAERQKHRATALPGENVPQRRGYWQ